MLCNLRVGWFFSPLGVIFMGLVFKLWIKVIKLYRSPHCKIRVSSSFHAVSISATCTERPLDKDMVQSAYVSGLHISLTGRKNEPTSCLCQ